jgi:hypothetical protein
VVNVVVNAGDVAICERSRFRLLKRLYKEKGDMDDLRDVVRFGETLVDT